MSIKMHEMSKTYQYRKVMKPLLERKRRARINKCLDELKDLMSECLAQQGENIIRLEKADILELTVDHLKRLRRKENTINSNSLSSTNDQSFRSGYVYAANEVSRALACYPGVDISLGTRVMAHLGHSLVQIENQKQDIITATTTTKSPLNSPLKVYCGSHINNIDAEINYTNINCNYNSPIQQLSPSASSGYGSDNESVSASLSISHHHCSDHHHHYHQGLLKIAATSFTVQSPITKKENDVNVWRPW